MQEIHIIALGFGGLLTATLTQAALPYLTIFVGIVGVASVVALVLLGDYAFAHGYQVLVRTYLSDSAELRTGNVFVWFPEYIVHDQSQFGPWSKRKRLPVQGQTVVIDVPEVLVPVNMGLYCLKVNTKVIGTVQSIEASDLMQNPVAIEQLCHDVIATALRKSVYEKPLDEALSEVQRLFLKDSEGISELLNVPTLAVKQLMLDADQHVAPADAGTQKAFDLLVQRQQESAQRSAVAAAMETQEQKVKLDSIALQGHRNAMMLQQEIYGKEGAALVEAAKHAKCLYLFTGAASEKIGASTVLTLPS